MYNVWAMTPYHEHGGSNNDRNSAKFGRLHEEHPSRCAESKTSLRLAAGMGRGQRKNDGSKKQHIYVGSVPDEGSAVPQYSYWS